MCMEEYLCLHVRTCRYIRITVQTAHTDRQQTDSRQTGCHRPLGLTRVLHCTLTAQGYTCHEVALPLRAGLCECVLGRRVMRRRKLPPARGATPKIHGAPFSVPLSPYSPARTKPSPPPAPVGREHIPPWPCARLAAPTPRQPARALSAAGDRVYLYRLVGGWPATPG